MGVVIQDTYDSKFQTKPENVYVVFEPEQIHILGGKQDIEGFKGFVEEQRVEQRVDDTSFEQPSEQRREETINPPFKEIGIIKTLKANLSIADRQKCN